MPRGKYLLGLLLLASLIFIVTVFVTFEFSFVFPKADFVSTRKEQAALEKARDDGGIGGEDVIGDRVVDETLLGIEKRNVAMDDNDPINDQSYSDDETDPKLSERNDYLSGFIGLGFIHAFVASLSVIIVSELGDKTFFIAAIMAMRHSRFVVFSGAALALIVMTILSVFLGFAITVIPRAFTYYASSVLFAVFGLRLLREGWNMSPNEGQEEYDEVQAELNKKDEELRKQQESTYVTDPETGVIRGGPSRRSKLIKFFSPIFLQAFTLTFLAEWGDRSQITTIILAARENVFGVALGGFLGHSLCTALAVIGGRIVAQRISVRTVTLIGGVVFMMFALSAFVIGP